MAEKILKILPVAAAFLLLTYTGCSKKNSNPVNPVVNSQDFGSVTLNGSGYNNTKINFVYNECAYINSDSNTACIMYGLNNSDTVLVEVIFPGSSVNNYAWIDYHDTTTISGVGVIYFNSDGNHEFYVPTAGGNTNITKYGVVGETVEGSFSGSVEDIVSASTISISGTFKSTRLNDE